MDADNLRLVHSSQGLCHGHWPRVTVWSRNVEDVPVLPSVRAGRFQLTESAGRVLLVCKQTFALDLK